MGKLSRKYRAEIIKKWINYKLEINIGLTNGLLNNMENNKKEI
jgi:hypothetical protein